MNELKERTNEWVNECNASINEKYIVQNIEFITKKCIFIRENETFRMKIGASQFLAVFKFTKKLPCPLDSFLW